VAIQKERYLRKFENGLKAMECLDLGRHVPRPSPPGDLTSRAIMQ
jgi:hypothetical protein